MIRNATVNMPERIVILVSTTAKMARLVVANIMIDTYGAFVNFSRRRKNGGRT